MKSEYQSVRKGVNAAAYSARLLVLGLVSLCLVGSTGPAPSREQVEFLSSDGVHLSATLYRPHLPRAEAALLLHEEGGSRERFVVLAEQLAQEGVTTLVFDLRGHGESQLQSNFRGELKAAEANSDEYHKDVEAALGLLRDEVASETSLFLLGLGEGALLALESTSSAEERGFRPHLCLMRPQIGVLDAVREEISAAPLIALVGRDDIVGTQVARELYRSADDGREVWQLDSGPGISESMLKRTDFCEDLTSWFRAASLRTRIERDRPSVVTNSNERL